MMKEKMIVCINEDEKIEAIQTLVAINKELIIVTFKQTIFQAMKDTGCDNVVLYEGINSLEEYDLSKVVKVIVISDQLKTIEKFSKIVRLFMHIPIIAVVKEKLYPDAMYEYLGVNLVVHYKTKIMADLVE